MLKPQNAIFTGGLLLAATCALAWGTLARPIAMVSDKLRVYRICEANRASACAWIPGCECCVPDLIEWTDPNVSLGHVERVRFPIASEQKCKSNEISRRQPIHPGEVSVLGVDSSDGIFFLLRHSESIEGGRLASRRRIVGDADGANSFAGAPGCGETRSSHGC